MSKKIVISNLTKSFGSKQVLRGVNLEVNKGESLVILGGSGSGKSVCIKIIATLLKSSSGSIQIDDQEITNLSSHERDDLMVKFGSEKMKTVMESLGISGDQAISNKMISKNIESAQKKVEGFNFDRRKGLLDFDNVISKQREIIYERRN